MEKQSKKKRHSYTREFKLKVSDWYMNSGKSIARTAQMSGVDRKQVRTCLKNEEIIQQQKSLWDRLHRKISDYGRRFIC